MEIVSLRLVASDDDLNSLFAKLVAGPPKIRDLRIHIVQDGLSVTGVYETFLPIPFESFWSVSVCDGKIVARLSGIKAVGVGVDFLKAYVVDAIGSKIGVLQRLDETFSLDLDHLLVEAGVALRTNLISVRCAPGQLTIESNGTKT